MARPQEYPWEDWLSTSRILVRGNDFKCSSVSLSVMLRNQAKRQGVAVKLRTEGDVVSVTVLGCRK